MITVLKTLVRQLRDDDQLTVNDLDAIQGEQERVTHFLNAIEGLQFARGPLLVVVTVDELDGLLDRSRGDCLPDLSVTTRSEAFQDGVARNRFA
jgi:hypothetical protein